MKDLGSWGTVPLAVALTALLTAVCGESLSPTVTPTIVATAVPSSTEAPAPDPTVTSVPLPTDEPTATVSIEPTQPAVEEESRLRYLALGDSYTIGQSVDEADRFPVQLANQLRDVGADVADPEIIARTGWTTTDLMAGIREVDPQGPYDLVTVLIGVNNQFQGWDVEEYSIGLDEVLERAVEFAGDDASRVVVLSIPDYGVTPFAARIGPGYVAEQIDLFNGIKKRQADGIRELKYLDITPISREAKSDLSLLADDDLHPSGKMYTRWVELLLPMALEVLGEQ